ncbi:MAG: HlyD family type I secretion periplasmic adaptor subunit [Rhodoferax sp.]|uniref:HlyD family type I secretion periplasmic adaptor subunit n=1 Tax=Rhodoferax sp. TaxID=50421 RepID=UPI0014001544|nr:HlyD family type I secretion periplasmic adaptor subunit [Rhodoferax sp.]NDP37699.1 HlyD family type I secretion periplasmic adaptor subunit [Rhodoferax sp.]
MSTASNQVAVTEILFDKSTDDEVNTDATWHARLGWWIVVGGIGGFLTWASLAPLDKGVPLSGTVTVETNKKAIQHATGGTVEAILVKEGDVVKAGDALVRMNNVQASADAEMARVQYFVARTAEARLLAEGEGKKMIEFPPELQGVKDDPRVARNISLQQQLFNSRTAAKQSELASINENIAGLSLQNKGMEESRDNKQQQLQFLKEQLDGLRDLTKNGFVSRNRLLDVEQSYAQVNAAISEDIGNIGRGKRQISELKSKYQQVMQEYQKEVRTQLSEVQKEANSLANRLSGLDYNLDNVLVKAPVSGTVIGLNVFTHGAVIAPGFKIMDIVPSDDPLVVEGRLPVQLIDKMGANLDVELIFSAFNQNKTPHIPGVVTQVSADRLVDEKTGEPYYKLLAKATPEGMKKITNLKIRAGMPVDLFVKTGERTLMNYLLKPIVDHLKMSMTEE